MESILQNITSFDTSILASLLGVLGASLVIVLGAGVFLGIFMYAMWAGKKAMTASLLALVFSGFLFSVFPYWNLVTNASDTGSLPLSSLYIKGGILAVFFLLARFAMGHSTRGVYAYETTKRWLNIFGLSFVTSGVLFTYVCQFLRAHEIYSVSSSLLFIIASPGALFWWPLSALAVVYLFSD